MNVPQLNYFLSLTLENVVNVAANHQMLTPEPRYPRTECWVVHADLVQ